MENNKFSIAFFDAKGYDKEYFGQANSDYEYEITYYEMHLNMDTVPIVATHDAVCVFVNDIVDRDIIKKLKDYGIKIIALRCAGFNNVDLKAASEFDIPVVRVPAYSPYAVAEHSIALLMALNRKIIRAHVRVREGNFSLNGLVGADMHGKTFGLIGTGRIGQILAKIVKGFGCKLLLNDKFPNEEWAKEIEGEYVDLEELYKKSDFIALMAPLTHETYHMINEKALAIMKPSVMVVNTSRGALIDTKALVEALKKNAIGGACLDVYEEEAKFFYKDLSDVNISDDTLARLLTFNNVLITSHQAFLTTEALVNIASTTLHNITQLINDEELENRVVEPK